MKRYPSLQILRAVAAWLVVYHHFMQIYFGLRSSTFLGKFFSDSGAFGVHIFFVISGFVMYLCTFKPGLDGKDFFVDRILRIVPVYWFYLLVLLALFSLNSAVFKATDWNLASLLMSMFFIPSENPSGLGPYPFLTVGWTLNFEMFFYASLSLFLVINKRFAILFCCLFLGVLPLVWQLKWPGGSVLSSMLLYEFVAGIVLSFFWKKFEPQVSWRKTMLGFAALALATYGFGANPSSKSIWFLSAIGMVFSFLCLDDVFTSTSATGRFLRYLGDISYSTYLNHSIVIATGAYYFGINGGFVPTMTTAIVLSVVIFTISAFSHKYVETGPFIRFLKSLLKNNRSVVAQRSAN
ncbi:acyltransferase [Vicingaceae bacterium]|nr:acyltransferase [Vicingaceae bacterium]